jgi:site-specific DNA-methyltransferase (adenine-specific)
VNERLTCSCGLDITPRFEGDTGWLFHMVGGHEVTVTCGRKIGPYDCCSVVEGDCLELMRALPDGCVDAVITSPPYNLGEGMEDKGGFRVGHSGSKWTRADLRDGYACWSDNLPYPAYVEQQKSVLRECWRVLDSAGAVFYNHKPRIVKGVCRTPLTLNPDLPLRQVIIWNRRSGFNFSESFYVPQHEWVVVYAKPDFRLRDKGASGIGDVWDIGPDTEASEHPASFPVGLPTLALETTTSQIVLDPYMGSGSTAIAAKSLGRHFLGFEISPEYCAIARKRIAAVEAQPNLFQPKAEQLNLSEGQLDANS